MTYKPTQLMLDWIAALRSSKFAQAKEQLAEPIGDEFAYCCLGVLETCTGKSPIQVGSQGVVFEDADGARASAFAFSSTVEAALGREETRHPDGYLTNHGNIELGVKPGAAGDVITGSGANDEFGWSFTEIADQLEKVYVNGTGNFQDYVIEDYDRRSEIEDDWEPCECGCDDDLGQYDCE